MLLGRLRITPVAHLTPRQILSEAALTQALENCAREPIHIPGAIQPHGMLFVLDADDFTILQVSANASPVLRLPLNQIVGHSATAIFGRDTANKIQNFVRAEGYDPLRAVTVALRGKFYDAVTHRTGPYMIVEFERSDIEAQQRDQSYYLDLVRNQAYLQAQISTIAELNDNLVKTVRDLTGFGRVKLYRFDEDWNGAVVAESRDPGRAAAMPSYLGMNFPASDIPPQARLLYQKNHLRLITDIRYEPSPLLPQLPEPVDLSFAVLRSVSPVHVQYLDNMNVVASLSISIIVEGKLWGLVACHHNAMLHVPYTMRAACEVIGHTYSAKLASLLAQQMRIRLEVQKHTTDQIVATWTKGATLDETLTEHQDRLLAVVMADGAAVLSNGFVQLLGDTPPLEVAEQIFALADKTPRRDLLASDDLTEWLLQHGYSVAHKGGGFLYIPLSVDGVNALLWFRRERAHHVNWAGNPEKPVEKTLAGYRLMPRASFHLWRETVQNRAAPWSPIDLDVARHMMTRLLLKI